jgi:hypothetical protein
VTSELPAISVTPEELAERITRIRPGMLLDEVRSTLGDEPFQEEQRGATTARFWRFRLTGRDRPGDPYEIYMGEFEGDVLAFGAVLPQG